MICANEHLLQRHEIIAIPPEDVAAEILIRSHLRPKQGAVHDPQNRTDMLHIEVLLSPEPFQSRHGFSP